MGHGGCVGTGVHLGGVGKEMFGEVGCGGVGWTAFGAVEEEDAGEGGHFFFNDG